MHAYDANPDTKSSDAPETGAPRPDPRFRILNWIGIINQLSSTMAETLIRPHDLSMREFTFLNHFSHRPDEGKSVTGVARAMQQPQPSVTKNVHKLIDKGCLEWRPHPRDGRSKLLYLTKEGRRRHGAAVKALSDPLAVPFEGWSDADLAAFFEKLDQLKCWFDDNRLPRDG